MLYCPEGVAHILGHRSRLYGQENHKRMYFIDQRTLGHDITLKTLSTLYGNSTNLVPKTAGEYFRSYHLGTSSAGLLQLGSGPHAGCQPPELVNAECRSLVTASSVLYAMTAERVENSA